MAITEREERALSKLCAISLHNFGPGSTEYAVACACYNVMRPNTPESFFRNNINGHLRTEWMRRSAPSLNAPNDERNP